MENIVVGKQECFFDGRTFPHGAEMCAADLCKLCDDGKFEIPPEMSLDDDELLADPGEAYFMPGA